MSGGGEPGHCARRHRAGSAEGGRGKDAGPADTPHLDPEALAALKAELSKPKSKSGVEAQRRRRCFGFGNRPRIDGRPGIAVGPAVDNPSDDPISAGDPAVPLPDRKPQ